MKSESQLIAKMEQNVLLLEKLDAKHRDAPESTPAEDLEAEIVAATSIVLLAWVMDLEDVVDQYITIARAKHVLSEYGAKEKA